MAGRLIYLARRKWRRIGHKETRDRSDYNKVDLMGGVGSCKCLLQGLLRYELEVLSGWLPSYVRYSSRSRNETPLH